MRERVLQEEREAKNSVMMPRRHSLTTFQNWICLESVHEKIEIKPKIFNELVHVGCHDCNEDVLCHCQK